MYLIVCALMKIAQNTDTTQKFRLTVTLMKIAQNVVVVVVVVLCWTLPPVT
jgi:hypothetical protein